MFTKEAHVSPLLHFGSRDAVPVVPVVPVVLGGLQGRRMREQACTSQSNTSFSRINLARPCDEC
jgi:hypothetical protein